MSRANLLKIIFGVAVLCVVLLLATWLLGGFVGLSPAGASALIIGTVASLALGIGLMVLIFLSHRSGHDHTAYEATRTSSDETERS